MAVTSYMSTDVASVPLLWMVPLGVYLATFVVAFSPAGGRAPRWPARFMPLAIIVPDAGAHRADEPARRRW